MKRVLLLHDTVVGYSQPDISEYYCDNRYKITGVILRWPRLRMNFPNIEISRRVNASPQALWDLLTDTSRWVEWGPSVLTVECSERYIQLGSKGRVRTAVGLWVPFIVTEMEDGRYWSWNVFRIPATGHRVDRLGKDACRLVFQVPIFAAPYAIVCQIALHRIARILKNP